ncbi:MAG TPA: M48 family metalloprotease [Burkholderiaceae bacterium]|nr:M48 family metalloprotease [Burkholderiaceae bacterium]
MRWSILSLILALAGPAARADDGILGVLARSQQLRLEQIAPADATSARAGVVRASFDALVQALHPVHPVELRVIRGEIVAETMQGRVVLANEKLADLGEGERLFILAHELGHVELQHWGETELLYLKWVPGAVTPEQTDPIAGPLGHDASGLAHRQELEADAFALNTLHALGRPWSDGLAAFMQLGVTQDTATHPGTRKRVASLRAAEAQWATQRQAATRNDPIVSVSRPD